MATSTTIQYLQTVDAVTGASLGPSPSNRRQIETFLTTLVNVAGGAATISITDGSWMAFDTNKSGASAAVFVTEAASVGGGNPLVCGVLLDAVSATFPASSPALDTRVVPCNVVVAGFAEADVDGAVVAGSPLTVDTTPGRAHVAVTGDIHVCGVALAADVANVAPVIVYKTF